MTTEPTNDALFMGLPYDEVAAAITFYQAYAHVHDTDTFRLTILRAELEACEASRTKLEHTRAKLRRDIYALEKRASYNSGEATG